MWWVLTPNLLPLLLVWSVVMERQRHDGPPAPSCTEMGGVMTVPPPAPGRPAPSLYSHWLWSVWCVGSWVWLCCRSADLPPKATPTPGAPWHAGPATLTGCTGSFASSPHVGSMPVPCRRILPTGILPRRRSAHQRGRGTHETAVVGGAMQLLMRTGTMAAPAWAGVTWRCPLRRVE